MPIFTRPTSRILAASGVQVTTASNTTEQTVLTVSVPAGAMGPNGYIQIIAEGSYTNSANNKTLRAKFGAATILGIVHTTVNNWNFEARVFNRNGASSQRYFVLGNNGTTTTQTLAAASTSAIDTSAVVAFLITIEKATGAETATLDSYSIEVVYGA